MKQNADLEYQCCLGPAADDISEDIRSNTEGQKSQSNQRICNTAETRANILSQNVSVRE